jgi:hypothetical protein
LAVFRGGAVVFSTTTLVDSGGSFPDGAFGVARFAFRVAALGTPRAALFVAACAGARDFFVAGLRADVLVALPASGVLPGEATFRAAFFTAPEEAFAASPEPAGATRGRVATPGTAPRPAARARGSAPVRLLRPRAVRAPADACPADVVLAPRVFLVRDAPPASSTTHVGAWSLAPGRPRTQRSTPASDSARARGGDSSRWSMRRPASRSQCRRK